MLALRIASGRLCLALLMAPSIALAQSGHPSKPAWAADQAAGDAAARHDQCVDALLAYGRAIPVAQSGAPDAPTRAAISKMLIAEGDCLLKLERRTEAEAAYEKAAPLSPDPGVAYFDLCATYYDAGDMAASLPACEKAIAADPRKADAYFIKGSILVGQATLVDGKYTVPAGTFETLAKYLELAPKGPHAADVRQMQDFLK